VAEIAARLSSLPLFAGVSVDELFRVASAGRRVNRAAGERLVDGDSRPTT